MFLWRWLSLSLLQSWVSVGAGAGAQDQAGPGFSGSAGPLGWLLSDKGPFQRSQEYVDFTERYQQGFTTKYKIYSLLPLSVGRRDIWTWYHTNPRIAEYQWELKSRSSSQYPSLPDVTEPPSKPPPADSSSAEATEEMKDATQRLNVSPGQKPSGLVLPVPITTSAPSDEDFTQHAAYVF
ncbi:unnamed protein product [Pleuronectes platessa]|uniref:Uncharacterized protein n=1 Tax=Pleuronectes platessa TaxID=8262 RepID=A0A9N7V185_PLEPL|nr:unnamed protein product [Pleuronectes platessa]